MNTAPRFQALWDRIGQQLREPKGWIGRLTGRVMVLLNRLPYSLSLKALSVRPTDRVLELGFGAGQSLGRLCALAAEGRVDAIDHSTEMVAMAQRRNKGLIQSGRLFLRRGAFSPLPFPSESFDRILLVNVLYFFDAAGKDIRECRRLLKPDGRLVLYVTERSTMEKWPFCEPRTHRTFDRRDALSLFEDAGFQRKDIEVRSVQLPFGIKGLIITIAMGSTHSKCRPLDYRLRVSEGG